MLKKDKSGVIYCFNKMCEKSECKHNQIHMGYPDGETIYDMTNLKELDKNNKCKNYELE